jgi:hypothetical protein
MIIILFLEDYILLPFAERKVFLSVNEKEVRIMIKKVGVLIIL